MRFTGLKYLQLLACLGLFACGSAERYDVVIVGGGASGTAAGLQAARMGARTLIVEEFDWLGGMLTSAGVSATDGNYRLRGGIWDEFRTELARHYGCDSALMTGWVSNVLFEPSVGDSIFKRLVAREPNLTVWYRSAAETAGRGKDVWRLGVRRDGRLRPVEADVLVDATELGDVARMAGVPYDVGMDSSAVTHEDIAPAEANGIVQDLTYVAVLKDYGRDVTIPRPDGYDPSLFACCCVNDLCIAPKEPHRMWSREMMITYGKLPNGKYMINWPIEGNDYYVDMIDMTPEERADAVRRAKNHTLSFVYFLQHELGFNTLGLADDEFPTDDRLPFIPYHREVAAHSRRRAFYAQRHHRPLRRNALPYGGRRGRLSGRSASYPLFGLGRSARPLFPSHPLVRFSAGHRDPRRISGVARSRKIGVGNQPRQRLHAPATRRVADRAGNGSLGGVGRGGGRRSVRSRGAQGAGGGARCGRLPAAVPRSAGR